MRKLSAYTVDPGRAGRVRDVVYNVQSWAAPKPLHSSNLASSSLKAVGKLVQAAIGQAIAVPRTPCLSVLQSR